VARGLFGCRVGDDASPSWAQFVDAIRDFERVDFDVPEAADADGFLFQLGPASWLPEPTFILGVTRQLEVVDSHGEHGSYLQVAMDFHFALDSDLEAVGSRSVWWFRGGGDDFSAWLESVNRDPIWQVVSIKPLGGFVISADET
jgi:hypothetical protein